MGPVEPGRETVGIRAGRDAPSGGPACQGGSRRAGNDREGGEDRRRPDTRIRWSGDPGAGDHPPPVHRSTQEPRGPRGRWPARRRSPESFGPAGIGRRVTGREGQVVEDLPNHLRALNHGEDRHRSTAARTAQRVHLVHLADQAGPSRLRASREPQPNASTQAGPADFQRRSPLHHGGPHLGVPQEALLLPIAAGSIRIPSVRECGLLVGIGDVSGYFDEEVQGIEHPEVRLVARVDRV